MKRLFRPLLLIAVTLPLVYLFHRAMDPGPIPALGAVATGLLAFAFRADWRWVAFGMLPGLFAGSGVHVYSHFAEARVESISQLSTHVAADAAVGFIGAVVVLGIVVKLDGLMFPRPLVCCRRAMNEKIVTQDRLAAMADSFRAQGRKLVLTNGCFDLLHVGHVRYLQAARALGDALAVAINGDDSVQSLKGAGRPLIPENERAEVVAALESVNYVVIFSQVRATQLLSKVRPSIYVKGGDYTPDTLDAEERRSLEAIGAEIRILPFEAGHSTSGLIERMKNLPPTR